MFWHRYTSDGCCRVQLENLQRGPDPQDVAESGSHIWPAQQLPTQSSVPDIILDSKASDDICCPIRASAEPVTAANERARALKAEVNFILNVFVCLFFCLLVLFVVVFNFVRNLFLHSFRVKTEKNWGRKKLNTHAPLQTTFWIFFYSIIKIATNSRHSWTDSIALSLRCRFRQTEQICRRKKLNTPAPLLNFRMYSTINFCNSPPFLNGQYDCLVADRWTLLTSVVSVLLDGGSTLSKEYDRCVGRVHDAWTHSY